jgi:regulator of sirC expression with transglutaminase-like and TPR domain
MAKFPYAGALMEATRRFVELVSGPGEPSLDLACSLIAACADQRVNASEVMDQLDTLAAGCTGSTITDLRTYLFGELGFRGNRDAYDDPDNSLLDKVLTRRVGIPITLSVLLMEAARRIGVPLVGIGAPGHFLVRHRDDSEMFIDAFNGGLVLDRAAAQRLVEELQPGIWPEQALEPISARAILLRMLSNLKAIYGQRNDSVALAWILELRAALPGVPASEQAELARVRTRFN